MTGLTVFDVVGTVGVFLIVLAYFLLQKGSLSPENPAYAIVNIVGSSLILVSLYDDWNLSAALIEIFWIAISLYGLFRRRR